METVEEPPIWIPIVDVWNPRPKPGHAWDVSTPAPAISTAWPLCLTDPAFFWTAMVTVEEPQFSPTADALAGTPVTRKYTALTDASLRALPQALHPALRAC